MTILFVNGSPNSNGNTAHLAATLLAGHDYGTLNLTDYHINAFGQTLPGDQFDEVIERIKQADVVVLGSPSIGIACAPRCVPSWNAAI